MRSATFEEKLVLANSPSLAPRPVKSKRSTAMPRAVRPSAMRRAARTSLPQGKQWANSAKGRGVPRGRAARRAAGRVERGGEPLARGVGEIEAFGRHGVLLRTARPPVAAIFYDATLARAGPDTAPRRPGMRRGRAAGTAVPCVPDPLRLWGKPLDRGSARPRRRWADHQRAGARVLRLRLSV